MVDPDSGWVSRAPPYSGYCWSPSCFGYAALTLCGAPSQRLPLHSGFLETPIAVLQPRSRRFGLLPVRSPLLGESLLISVPGLLRWFTSPSVAHAAYFIRLSMCAPRGARVTPFGYPRVKGYVLLTAAYRSLSRPSSPYSSQASAIDLFSLDHIVYSAAIRPCARGLLSSIAPPADSTTNGRHSLFPLHVKDPTPKQIIWLYTGTDKS